MLSRRRVGGVFAIAVMTVGLAATALAGKADPALTCAAVKLKTTGATASAMLGCHAKAALKGLVTDPECLDGAAAKLAAAFEKAEAVVTKAGALCASDAAAAETQGTINTFVANVVTALRLQAGASKCVAKKLGSVGKQAQKVLGTHAANLVKPEAAKSVDKLAKADAVLAAIFAKLDDKAKDCQTTGDEQNMAAAVGSLIVAEICDDTNLCTTDSITGLLCQHTPVTCSEHYACDLGTGSCEPNDCCLMRVGESLCVVEIPIAQIPTSKAFCESTDAAYDNLTLINYGPNCVGWRATGADDCF